MNNKKYHTVRTVPKYIRKIKGRCKIDTPTHMMADFPSLLHFNKKWWVC
jgi:hypothetical protein